MGRPFVNLKFRTMLDALDPHGRPLSDTVRLTKLGKFLRSLSLDELPELFNVLRGEMSLVGPRPLLMQYLDRYSPEQAEERREEEKNTTGRYPLRCLVCRSLVALAGRTHTDTTLKALTREGIKQLTHATAEAPGNFSQMFLLARI
jgi:hypothetical protein